MSEFTENVDHVLWQNVYNQYQDVLLAKAEKMKENKKKELLKLDKWYQTELPQLITSRKEKYINHTEICQLMTWKLTRGKFRPRLQQMVASNSGEDVQSSSEKAFKLLPDLSAAVQALTVLKAIGPATASAILAAGNEEVPFMADESVLALPGFTSLEYNLKTYLKYASQVKDLTKKLKKKDKEFNWTDHKVEITLWTYYLGSKLIPDFTEKLDSETKDKDNGTSGPAKKKRKC